MSSSENPKVTSTSLIEKIVKVINCDKTEGINHKSLIPHYSSVPGVNHTDYLLLLTSTFYRSIKQFHLANKGRRKSSWKTIFIFER